MKLVGLIVVIHMYSISVAGGLTVETRKTRFRYENSDKHCIIY